MRREGKKTWKKSQEYGEHWDTKPQEINSTHKEVPEIHSVTPCKHRTDETCSERGFLWGQQSLHGNLKTSSRQMHLFGERGCRSRCQNRNSDSFTVALPPRSANNAKINVSLMSEPLFKHLLMNVD